MENEITANVQTEVSSKGNLGGIASRLMDADFKTNALRTNDTLRFVEWQRYDQALVRETIRPQRAVNALRAAGLTYALGDGLGSMVLMYEDVSDLTDANMSMDAESQRDNDRVEFTQKYLPMPIVHKSWFVNGRTLNASRKTGESLDVTQTAYAGRKIGEYIENMTLNGANSYNFGNGTIYGMTDHPSKNNIAMAIDWATADPLLILDDILAGVQAVQNDWFYGPYILFVSANCEAHFGTDYSSHYAKATLSRIREVNNIQDVVFCPFLNKTVAASQGVLVQATPDVIRLVEGLPLTNVQWEEKGNLRFHFKAMQICVPQVRATQAGRMGLCHFKAGLSSAAN